MLSKTGLVAVIGLMVISRAALAQAGTPAAEASRLSPQSQQKTVNATQLQVQGRVEIEKSAVREIKRNWYPPKCNPGPKSAIIRIQVDRQGSVREKYLVSSSGVSRFDEAAMNAIEYQPKSFFALRNLYPDGVMEVVFNGIFHPDAVTLRAVRGGVKPPDRAAGEGEGSSRITGKIVGARANQRAK